LSWRKSISGVFLASKNLHQVNKNGKVPEEAPMRIWKRVILISLLAVMLVAAVTPAIAKDKVTLFVRNLTQSTVELKLNGPETVKLRIAQPYAKVELEPGTYSYRYVACGRLITGTIKVANGTTLKLVKCEKGFNATLKITNLTGKTFYLLLNGPKAYLLTILPGDYKYTVQAGRYEYKATVCGTVRTGEKGLKSKNNDDWIWSCK
jgi:hypothetical protein